jgi:malate permease and related proteins
MISFQELVTSVVPLFALFSLGYLFKRSHFISSAVQEGLKKLTVDVALPSLLFVAFFSLSVSKGMVIMVGLLFLSCLIMLALGRIIAGRIQPGRRTAPFLFAGYEAGMLGYALFLSLFGKEELGVFAATDLGQVLFVFLVLMPLLVRGTGEEATFFSGFTRALRSPVIIAIISGLIVGVLNRFFPFAETTLFLTFRSLLDILGGLTVPLICISIGYTMEINRKRLPSALGVIGLRLVLNGVLAAGISFLLLRDILPLPRIYLAAVWTMFLLPPPFVIPVFLKPGEAEEEAFASAVLSLHTLVSVILIPLLILLFISF